MKNKGFSLIELIVTIGIMALIGIVISSNMLGLFSKEEDKDYENFIKQIEDSACMYVETAMSTAERNNCKNSGCTITVDKLIAKGYIEDTLKDPSTQELIVNNKRKYSVKVTWINNVKTCNINR